MDVHTGEFIELGGYDWRVLAVEDEKALIVGEKILFNKEYGSTSAWKDCELREYLNGTFYESAFSDEEKARIVETDMADGLLDKVFLLDVEETVRYFGDTGQYAKGLKYINDEYNAARIAVARDSGEASWWFLRSAGGPENLAVCVGDDGGIYVFGHNVTVQKAGAGGIRPALRVIR